MEGGYSVELWLSKADELHPQAELQRKVWEELRWEPILDPSNITVEVVESAVTLRGVVKSYPEKLVAARAAKRVAAVSAVHDELTIRLPPAHCRTDAELAIAVTQLLQWDVRVPHRRIGVGVAGGMVRLDGQVTHEFERTAAEEAVRNLVGVTGVTNRIQLHPEASAGDVKRRVEEALKRCPELRGDRIRVEMHGGQVVLHGHVRSLAEREEAEHAVRDVPGVTEVEDDLTVG